MSEKVEAVNVKFFYTDTKALIEIMDCYKGLVGSEEEVRLRNFLLKIVEKLQPLVKPDTTPNNNDPMMTHYLTQKDVNAYHEFAFQALCDENPILEPFWDEFGYELYDSWQTYYLLFEDRKEEVDPKLLELE